MDSTARSWKLKKMVVRMEKTLFIHVWIWKKDGKELIQEQTPTASIEDAVKEYWQQDLIYVEYSHTLHVHYNTASPSQSFAREMDISDFLQKKEG